MCIAALALDFHTYSYCENLQRRDTTNPPRWWMARVTAVGSAPGHAASAREAAKVRKYQPICDRIDAQFRGAVIERHGHCGDGMCSIIELLSGDGERDLMQEDTSFTAPSRTTYVAQHLVFAAVMADAAMVDDALASALHRLPRGRGARS